MHTKKRRILLAEDEENLVAIIKFNLELEDYEVIIAKNGKEAIDCFRSSRIDLIILDVMMPELDGFTVCQTIRLENSKTPILFLTAKGSSADRVKGLKLGADDYLVKPFNLEEFLLRIKILLKRIEPEISPKPNDSAFSFDEFYINFNTYEIKGLDGVKKLSRKEIMLLKLLVEKRNQVVSRNEILELVWGYDSFPTSRTIDNFILTFRKNFERNQKQPVYFQSVRSVGYLFSLETEK